MISRTNLGLCSICWLLVFSLFALSATPAQADIIKLADGRTFEGELIENADGSLMIKTKISSITATLRVTKPEIEQVIKKSLPADFFTSKKKEKAVRNKNIKLEGNPYLEIPIVGTIGKEVQVKGVEQSLAYAVEKGIEHILFTVDCSAGEFGDSRNLYLLLEEYSEALTFHALVTEARGPGMIVPIWCSSIHTFPDAFLGGGEKTMEGVDEEGEPIDRAATAARIAAKAQERGFPGLVVAAMIMEEETVAVWRDSADKINISFALPEGIERDRVIVQDGPGTRLVLTHAQAIAIGIAKPTKGTREEIGQLLHAAGWAPESDYGQRAMKRAHKKFANEASRAEQKTVRLQRDIDRNIEQHREVTGFILACLHDYAQYDPAKGKYATHKVASGWGGWYGEYSYAQRDTNLYTDDSLREWRMRTDRSIYALKHLRKGIRKLKSLDRKAEKLNIVRDSAKELGQYIEVDKGEGAVLDLDNLQKWVERELVRLAKDRNRKGS